MLHCLVVVVHLWRVLEVAGDELRTRDIVGAYVAVVVSPPLDIGVAIPDVGDSGGGDEEDGLAADILVADGYKIYIIDGSGKDETPPRCKIWYI